MTRCITRENKGRSRPSLWSHSTWPGASIMCHSRATRTGDPPLPEVHHGVLPQSSLSLLWAWLKLKLYLFCTHPKMLMAFALTAVLGAVCVWVWMCEGVQTCLPAVSELEGFSLDSNSNWLSREAPALIW